MGVASYLLLPCAPNLKTAIILFKWTRGRHHGAEDAFLITHLHSLDCLIGAQGGVDWNRLVDKPTIVLSFHDERTQYGSKTAFFGH